MSTPTSSMSSDGTPTSDSKSSETSLSTLDASKGQTTIDDAVVTKIASMAAQEVEGVARLGGAMSSAIASVVGRIRGDEHATPGVGVEVGETQAAVDLSLIVTYPAPIPAVARNVRENVVSRIEELTGLAVVEVNIAVTDLKFPGEEDDSVDEGRSDSRVQ